MQLLAKFKRNSVHVVQSHLKFSKIEDGSEPQQEIVKCPAYAFRDFDTSFRTSVHNCGIQ